MGEAMTTLGNVLRILSALVFYGMMAAIILMLYRLSKDVSEVKRSIIDLRETITLAQLPREAKPDRAEHLS